MAENGPVMLARVTLLTSLTITLALVACTKQDAPRAYGPTNSREAALRVADAALVSIPAARRPYSVRQEGERWLIATAPGPPPSNANYLVVIEAATGRTEVTAHQTATIDEDL